MTTALLIGLLVWMVGLECRLWINIRRLNELLEELPQEMNFLRGSATATTTSRPQDAPEFVTGTEPEAFRRPASAGNAPSALSMRLN
jgi:hypothetical protein